MIEFDTLQWIVIIFCAAMIGFSKTGIPGCAILVVPTLAAIMPARQSTGFLLLILSLADVMAVIYWRKHVEWKQLGRLLPPTLAGIVLGFFIMGKITDRQLMPVIGGLILILITVAWWRNRYGRDEKLPHSRGFAVLMGALAGTTSMLANAAGPVMTIYLLAMRLRKNEFVGTTAWFFWIVNLIKIPFSYKLHLITSQSLRTNLALIPATLIGGILGIILVHRISQKAFNGVVTLLAVLAAIYLCIKAFIPLQN
jgi:uncharacterized protein